MGQTPFFLFMTGKIYQFGRAFESMYIFNFNIVCKFKNFSIKKTPVPETGTRVITPAVPP